MSYGSPLGSERSSKLLPRETLAAIFHHESPGARLQFIDQFQSSLQMDPEVCREGRVHELKRSLDLNWPLSEQTQPEGLEALQAPGTPAEERRAQVIKEVREYLVRARGVSLADLFFEPAFREAVPLLKAADQLCRKGFMNPPEPEVLRFLRAGSAEEELREDLLRSGRTAGWPKNAIEACLFFARLQQEAGMFEPGDPVTRAQVLKRVAARAEHADISAQDLQCLPPLIALFRFSEAEISACLGEVFKGWLIRNQTIDPGRFRPFQAIDLQPVSFQEVFAAALEGVFKDIRYDSGPRRQARFDELKRAGEALGYPEILRGSISGLFGQALEAGDLLSLSIHHEIFQELGVFEDRGLVAEFRQKAETGYSSFLRAAASWVSHRSQIPEFMLWYFNEALPVENLSFHRLDSAPEFISGMKEHVASLGTGRFALWMPEDVLRVLGYLKDSAEPKLQGLLSSELVRGQMDRFLRYLADSTTDPLEKRLEQKAQVERYLGVAFPEIAMRENES